MCQEDFDNKMWGVVSMFVVGSEQCLLQIEALYLRRGWRFADDRKTVADAT